MPDPVRLISRRQALRVSLAAGLVPASLPAAANAGDVFTGLPLLALNAGRWDGTYTFVRADGEIVQRYDFEITVSLSSDNARAYRQDSRYRFADGKTSELQFEAAYREGRLVWDNGRINGQLWQISDDTLYLNFGFNEKPETVCHEMIQTSADGRQRGRSWLWYESGRLDRYTLIDERRADAGPPIRSEKS
jgi:hypothetical protein